MFRFIYTTLFGFQRRMPANGCHSRGGIRIHHGGRRAVCVIRRARCDRTPAGRTRGDPRPGDLHKSTPSALQPRRVELCMWELRSSTRNRRSRSRVELCRSVGPSAEVSRHIRSRVLGDREHSAAESAPEPRRVRPAKRAGQSDQAQMRSNASWSNGISQHSAIRPPATRKTPTVSQLTSTPSRSARPPASWTTRPAISAAPWTVTRNE